MKVELSKDPLFQIKDSPLKQLKSKEIERQRSNRLKQLNLFQKKPESDREIIDPLPSELKQYRTETTYKKSVETSKASESLKKYIIQQQQNLRCLRLERLQEEAEQPQSPPKKKKLNITLSPVSKQKDEEKLNKEIHIPSIEELFKNQKQEYILYENHTEYDRAEKVVQKMNGAIKSIKERSKSFFVGANPESRKSDREKNLPNGEDEEIDNKIKKNMRKSKKLQDIIYKEKRGALNAGAGNGQSGREAGIKSSDMSFFLRAIEKPKKKVQLEGVKSYTFKNGQKRLSVTAATGLLFELHNLSDNKEKKEYELAGLLKNSFQNRDSILSEKASFYERETDFADLSPSNQFKLRRLMNEKLDKRLERSKEQVNNFTTYLSEIKGYHQILDDNILEILKEVRKNLLSGKVMKKSDFAAILARFSEDELNFDPNSKIISHLEDMMI